MQDHRSTDVFTYTFTVDFPQCEECPAGNMAQNIIPPEESDKAFVVGEEFVVDIKVWANNSKALKHRGRSSVTLEY